MKLADVYARLPRIECKRLCVSSCEPIAWSRSEGHAMRRAAGVKSIGLVGPDMLCPMLDREAGLCTIYEARPLICRLFGLVDNDLLRCRYGCVPERWVTPEEVRELFILVGKQMKDKWERTTLPLRADEKNLAGVQRAVLRHFSDDPRVRRAFASSTIHED